jgi:hypothetical protein
MRKAAGTKDKRRIAAEIENRTRTAALTEDSMRIAAQSTGGGHLS